MHYSEDEIVEWEKQLELVAGTLEAS